MGIEYEVLGTLNLLQMDLGVLEGQTSRGLFSNSIFDPSVIGASGHWCSYNRPYWNWGGTDDHTFVQSKILVTKIFFLFFVKQIGWGFNRR